MSRPLGLCLVLLALVGVYATAELVRSGGPSGAAGSAPGARPRVAPEAVLPAPGQVGEGWEAVEEAALDPRGDPQLRGWGVRALRTRHYAQRGAPGSSRVCSVEVWVLGDAGEARAAKADYTPTGWQVEREGPLLVLAHGVTLALGEPLAPGLFPACRAIAERARARGARLLRESAGER